MSDISSKLESQDGFSSTEDIGNNVKGTRKKLISI